MCSYCTGYRYRNSQTKRDGSSGFDLFNEVILIYKVIGILRFVIIGIFVTMIILDLNGSCHSLRTEGVLIPSGTTRNNLGDQIVPISINDFCQQLGKI